jgi:hypothetical protein
MHRSNQLRGEQWDDDDGVAVQAIAAKRYLEGGTFDTGFNGGAVATKIDPSEFEYALAVALQSGKIIAAGHSVLAGQRTTRSSSQEAPSIRRPAPRASSSLATPPMVRSTRLSPAGRDS